MKTPGFPYKLSKTPARIDRPTPLAGQHTREILDELGYGADEVATLLQHGAIAAEELA